MSISFRRISTWDPAFVAAIRRHYPGSRGAPVGKKMAWEIYENGQRRDWIGIGEPAYKLAARRRLGIEDARPLPRTVGNFFFRLEEPGRARASEILGVFHRQAAQDWEEQYGWAPEHWETIIDPSKTLSRVVGACYRRAGYRHIGSTTGNTALRPPGSTHGPRIWQKGTAIKEVFYRGPLAREPR